MSKALAARLSGKKQEVQESVGDAVAAPTVLVAIAAITLSIFSEDGVEAVLMMLAPFAMAAAIIAFVGRSVRYDTYWPGTLRGAINSGLSIGGGLMAFVISNHYGLSYGSGAALALWTTTVMFGMIVPNIIDRRHR